MKNNVKLIVFFSLAFLFSNNLSFTQPKIKLSSNSINFGTLENDGYALTFHDVTTRYIRITNDSDFPLEIISITTDMNNSTMEVKLSLLGEWGKEIHNIIIPPGETKTLDINFKAKVGSPKGPRTGTLTIKHNASGPPKSIKISGTIAPKPLYSITPEKIDFDKSKPSVIAITIYVYTNSPSPIVISSDELVHYNGDDMYEYTENFFSMITNHKYPITVLPGKYHKIEVKYTPPELPDGEYTNRTKYSREGKGPKQHPVQLNIYYNENFIIGKRLIYNWW
jgi:LEA14-like dessication related protein